MSTIPGLKQPSLSEVQHVTDLIPRRARYQQLFHHHLDLDLEILAAFNSIVTRSSPAAMLFLMVHCDSLVSRRFGFLDGDEDCSHCFVMGYWDRVVSHCLRLEDSGKVLLCCCILVNGMLLLESG